jgi:hypothetical protein
MTGEEIERMTQRRTVTDAELRKMNERAHRRVERESRRR